ncbi:glycosyltransferase family 4 protein [Flavobacterium sp.]|uniref:glycosyltransferase family 4 protein n=1 Tax=Flavobacterium sp. TaxID=239 RepID=UPI0028BEF444|nr:glycosyltransferase family 4 protein [Flavobacterium sp.]
MELNTTKKIAVLCDYRLMPERVGGMDRFFWKFDKYCKQNGCEIVWFFPNKASHGEYENLVIHSAETKSIEAAFLAYCSFHNCEFDVVVTHFLELCTSFFKKVKANSSCKTIAVDHNPRPIRGYSLKKRIGKRVKGLLYSRYTDLFVGVSEYTQNHILRDFGFHLKSKTIVVYNGIVHELYQKRSQRNLSKPTFLVACHLRFSKGIQDLIKAVAMLPDSIKKEIRIDVYGEGEYKSILVNMIETYKLAPVFTFKGSVPNLYEVYGQYDYLLQPTHMECFSLSILESLSANVPVITTSVGGNEEAVFDGKNGYIFKPKDVKALSGILERVYLGESHIDEKTNSYIEENFSIEKMVSEHYKLL